MGLLVQYSNKAFVRMKDIAMSTLYRNELKGVYVLLSRTEAGPGRAVSKSRMNIPAQAF